MARFVQHAGVIDIKVGDTPSRNGTPILEVPNVVQGNQVAITLNMFARTNQEGRSQGFYFDIAPVNAREVQALTSTGGLFQGESGWQSVTKIAFFEILNPSQSPTEDVDFEVLFTKGDISGTGQIRDFTLVASVVSQANP